MGDSSKAAGQIALILVLCAAISPARARSYAPVACEGAAAYQGPAPHAAPTPSDMQVAGALGGALPGSTAAQLQATFDAGLAASPQARSVTAFIGAPDRGSWSATRYAKGDPPDAVFYWASAGKMFTAAVVLQLIDEGRLGLDTTIARWAPDVPNAHAITIEHLLNHTSGLFSVNEDLRIRMRKHPRLSFEEQVKVMRKHGAMFCPGERWRYTNSGYAVLGRIIESLENRSFNEVVETRIIRKLGLRRTYALSPDAPLPPLTRIVSVSDEHALQPLTPGPAGPIAASASDMATFLQAYLDGQLISRRLTDKLLERPLPGFDTGTFFGLGLMLYDVPDTPRRVYFIGHSGGGPGASATVVWSPQDRAFAAAALTGGGSSTAFANGLLKTYSSIPTTGRDP